MGGGFFGFAGAVTQYTAILRKLKAEIINPSSQAGKPFFSSSVKALIIPRQSPASNFDVGVYNLTPGLPGGFRSGCF